MKNTMSEQEMDAEIASAKASLIRMSCCAAIYVIATVESIKEAYAHHLWAGFIELAVVTIAMNFYMRFE